jgi:hypothetical protein
MSISIQSPSQSSGTFTMVEFKQIAYSRNGCPRWQFTMAETHATTPITFVTASGASSAYGASPRSSDIGEQYQVRYHRTKGGNLVADAWSKVGASDFPTDGNPHP